MENEGFVRFEVSPTNSPLRRPQIPHRLLVGEGLDLWRVVWVSNLFRAARHASAPLVHEFRVCPASASKIGLRA